MNIQTADKEQENYIYSLLEAEEFAKAFEKIVPLYSPPLYGLIRRMVLTHQNADDVLQNTFVKAWQSIHYFRGDAKIYTWLYKIAVNESLSFLNRNKKKEGYTLNECSHLAQELESDPYFNGEELEIRLQQAIALLPSKQKLVFNMRYFQEIAYEEMSQILDTSVGSLKATYHHAVKKIEKFFTEN